MMNSLFSVAGKNVVVTGASRGLGMHIAEGYVRAGANVVITGRHQDVLQQTCDEIKKKLSKENDKSVTSITSISADISKRSGCNDLASKIKQVDIFKNGKLDVLVNNAGNAWGEPLSKNSGKINWGWDRVLDLNVKGLFYLTRECIPLLRRDKLEGHVANENGCGPYDDPGRVINIGSVVGILPQEAPTHAYDASKAAVHHLTKKLSGELALMGITVNAVAPGFFPTRMSKGLEKYATFEEMTRNCPMRRLGEAKDIQGACLYLSSEAGSYCNGIILPVDGGYTGSTTMPLANDEI